MSTWVLADAEERAKASRTFEIPSKTIRESRNVGDVVKLVFVLNNQHEDGASGERMWVEITTVTRCHTGERRYEGKLLNVPTLIKDLQLDSVVQFEPKHIAAE